MPIHHFTNANFCSPQSPVGAKKLQSGELIRQNVTEQHTILPPERKLVLVKWRIAVEFIGNPLTSNKYCGPTNMFFQYAKKCPNGKTYTIHHFSNAILIRPKTWGQKTANLAN